MALAKTDIKTAYPLPLYNYKVSILGDSNVNVIGFSEVSGLNVECQAVIYRHGLSFASGVNIISGMQSHTDPYSATAKRDVVIDLCDETGFPVIRWKALNALPTKIDAPNFTANSNEVAIASMELIAADLKVDYKPS
jgi:hypothetical protein